MPFTFMPITHPSARPLEPCCVPDCPDPLGGPTAKGQCRPRRVSVRKFGLSGVGCLSCYHRLVREQQRERRDAERARRAVCRPVVPEGAKWCPQCRDVKPATTDHFYRNRSRGDGLSGYCKVHHRTYQWVGREVGKFAASPETVRAARARYEAKPGYRARKAAWARRRRQTLLGRLRNDKASLKSKLKRTSDPLRRARLEGRLALIECELARIEEARRPEAEALAS